MPESTQTLRIDCPDCRGNGYTRGQASEVICERCAGGGLLEKEVPFKAETRGRWTREEVAEVFGLEPTFIKDASHSAGNDDPYNG